jgi:ubiquitin-protein ligase
VTPQELRLRRLASDYEEMRAIRGAIIHWEAAGGVRPHYDSYDLTVRVRTIVGPGPQYVDLVRLRLELPAAYPFKAAPVIRVVAPPLPFHPNWWPDGRWCPGRWAPTETLGRHVIRMVRMLQCDPTLTNLQSPANGEATNWWRAVQNRGWFPCDRQVLPDPRRKVGGVVTVVSPAVRRAAQGGV